MTKLSSSPVIPAGGQASTIQRKYTIQCESIPDLIKLHLLAMPKARFPMMQSNMGCSDFEPNFPEVEDYWMCLNTLAETTSYEVTISHYLISCLTGI